MESFLKYIEKNYQIFNMFDGNLSSYKYPQDIIEVLTIIMKKANKLYLEKCSEAKAQPYEFSGFYLEKDPEGKCYLKVVGADKKTIVIIRQDDSDYMYYKHIMGKKLTESEFFRILDFYQKEKLARSGISKRFIKNDIEPINGLEEINAKSLIAYYEYLKEYYLESISNKKTFVEPDSTEISTVRNYTGENADRQRKHEIIDYELRKNELLKYQPFAIYNFVGARSREEVDVYVYEQGGYIIAIAEPISGLSYTKILNLGLINANNQELISNNIQAALEASEDIVLADDAIIRKNHTSFEMFKKNLEVLFAENTELRKFYNDVEASKSVYRR